MYSWNDGLFVKFVLFVFWGLFWPSCGSVFLLQHFALLLLPFIVNLVSAIKHNYLYHLEPVFNLASHTKIF